MQMSGWAALMCCAWVHVFWMGGLQCVLSNQGLYTARLHTNNQ
jgi:hypothetical protein